VRYGSPSAWCAATAAAIFTIATNATVPSCMRVPPDAVDASTGSRSAVARSIACTRRSAEATPMEPARNWNSHAMSTTRRPSTSASPVMIDSSTPLFAAAAASSSR
jgi:hypothetical protein